MRAADHLIFVVCASVVLIAIVSYAIRAFILLMRDEKLRYKPTRRPHKAKPRKSAPGSVGNGISSGYKSLLTACLGDTALAERLIAFEVQRNPGISRQQAIAMAFDRLAYDRSR